MANQVSHRKSGMNRERQIPSPLWACMGRFYIFVIPAKAGIQRIEAKFATRNQV